MEEIIDIKNLKEMLDKTRDRFQDDVAYKIKENNEYKTVTHKEVRDKVQYLSAKIIDVGFKGQKIAVMGDNSMNWEIAYLAICYSGAIVVPIDKTLPLNEIERIIRISNAIAVFSFPKRYADFKNIRNLKANNLEYVFSLDEIDSLCKEGSKSYKKDSNKYNVLINPKQIASLLFTSGTTSKSKVVALTHENICTNLRDLSFRMQIEKSDIFLSFLPVHHAFECTFGFLLPMYCGACITFADGVRHIIDNLKEYHASIMACVPAVYENILKNIKRNLAKENLLDDYLSKIEMAHTTSMDKRKEMFKEIHNMLGNNIKYLISGAAYLNENIEKEFREFGINLMQGYGLTETSPVISMCSNLNYHLGSVGKPLDGVEVKIDSPNADGVGELIVKGKSVMLGYYQDGKIDRSSFKNNYFYTGDLAKIDKDGYIYICGRKKDTIVLKNGKNIYPEEIEYLINRVSGVKESLIYSLTEDKSDVRINAKIVFDRKIMAENYHVQSDQEIYNILFDEIKKINKTIPEYKAIKGIVLTEEPLILTSTNKLKRQENILAINAV